MNETINYKNHPAFSEYISRDHENSKIKEFINDFSLKDPEIPLTQVLSEVRKLPNIDKSFVPFLLRAFNDAVSRYKREEKLKGLSINEKQKSRVQESKDLKSPVIQYQMSEVNLRKLAKTIAPEIQFLKKLKKYDKPRVKYINASKPVDLINNFLEQNEIFNFLEIRFGFEFEKIKGFGLHLSDARDTWFHPFGSTRNKVPKTTQFHYDLEYAIPKAMLYLNKVNDSNGPFGYIDNDDLNLLSGFRLCLAKEIDYALLEFACASGKLIRGRNKFSLESIRRLYVSLPKCLRLTALPGDHLRDNSRLSNFLLKKENVIFGDAGKLALFCGSETLHRGGVVKEGERLAAQICFEPKDKSLLKTNLPTKKIVGRKFSNDEFSRKLVDISPQRDLKLVDVGGAGGVPPHWMRLPKVAWTYVFEPHAESFIELIEKQKNDPIQHLYNTYLMIALGKKNERKQFFKTNQPTGSSFYAPNPESTGNAPKNKYFYPYDVEEIEVQTLSSALSIFKIDHVDAIKLDTQGSELEILKGMGKKLLKELLLVEIEIPVLETYANSPNRLEKVLPFVQNQGLDLFDFRCNRFAGNCTSKKDNFLETNLEAKWGSTALAGRLIEVDAIFFKDPKRLIDEGTTSEKLRRLICLLSVYYFFPEACFAVHYAHEKGIFSQKEKREILISLKSLCGMAKNQSRIYQKHLNEPGRNNMNWGQYMHVPSPSS